jgi:hypothetical protein
MRLESDLRQLERKIEEAVNAEAFTREQHEHSQNALTELRALQKDQLEALAVLRRAQIVSVKEPSAPVTAESARARRRA